MYLWDLFASDIYMSTNKCMDVKMLILLSLCFVDQWRISYYMYVIFSLLCVDVFVCHSVCACAVWSDQILGMPVGIMYSWKSAVQGVPWQSIVGMGP